MSGLDYYMNDAGLLVCETTIAQTRFDVNGMPAGLAHPPGAPVRRLASTRPCAILEEGNNGLYTNEWLLADTKTNEIAMFELGTHKTQALAQQQERVVRRHRGLLLGLQQRQGPATSGSRRSPALEGRPANVVFHPSDRDRKWLQLYDKHKGKIDADFGKLAFTTPPLAASHSLDAKFTTTAMAKELKTWALFGPPLGHAWEPTDGRAAAVPRHRARWSATTGPSSTPGPPDGPPMPHGRRRPRAIDPARDGDEGPTRPTASGPPAWHGTILPADRRRHLARRRVRRLREDRRPRAVAQGPAKDGKLTGRRPGPARRRPLRARPSATWRPWPAAGARTFRSPRPAPTCARDEWYDIAAGKGVLVLAELRKRWATRPSWTFMDAFGRAHAGKPRRHGRLLRRGREGPWQAPRHRSRPTGSTATALAKLGDDARARQASGRFWAVDSFERQLDATLIVYGTLAEADAQREAADMLRRKLAARCANILIPIKADRDVTDDELRSNHVLLIGRPATNRITARLAGSLPVRFGPASFRLRDRTYAHPHTALAAAGPNPLAKPGTAPSSSSPAWCAEGTWQAIRRFPDGGPVRCEVLLDGSRLPARGSLVVPPGQSAGVAVR